MAKTSLGTTIVTANVRRVNAGKLEHLVDRWCTFLFCTYFVFRNESIHDMLLLLSGISSCSSFFLFYFMNEMNTEFHYFVE